MHTSQTRRSPVFVLPAGYAHMKFAVIVCSNDPETVWNALRFATPRCQDSCRLLFITLRGRKGVNHDAVRSGTEGVSGPPDAGIA